MGCNSWKVFINMVQPDVGEIAVAVIDSAFRFYLFFGVFRPNVLLFIWNPYGRSLHNGDYLLVTSYAHHKQK